MKGRAGRAARRAGLHGRTAGKGGGRAGKAGDRDAPHTHAGRAAGPHKTGLVAGQYGDMAEKLGLLIQKAAQADEPRSRVSTLETVVSHHTAELQALRKAK